MLAALMSGKSKVLARPATGEPGHFTSATSGDTVAIGTNHSSTANSGAAFLIFFVALATFVLQKIFTLILC